MVTEDVSKRCNMACEVLQKTNDGDDLSPGHLWILQEWVNGHLNDEGEKVFVGIHTQVMAGTYKKPWLYGVVHLTQDHEGYVYWKGKQVEHYSFDDYKKGKAAAQELAQRCLILEKKGVEVNCLHAVWKWDDSKPDGGY